MMLIKYFPVIATLFFLGTTDSGNNFVSKRAMIIGAIPLLSKISPLSLP